jgi:hypothetical protein
MAIKGQLARIERHLAKRGSHPITFIIPYSSDKQKIKEIQQRLIRENGKRETNPPGQEIRKLVFDYDSLTTHREEVRKAFDCYAP